ncbi:YceI family protein [Mesonia aquimarina]|uniref:YceI family protein n=1 Tax=Mesonia aquimarina TaxID=1504967 RepID=UPI001F09DFF5|nr:YceI family protein [Mesonia aquimarina]
MENFKFGDYLNLNNQIMKKAFLNVFLLATIGIAAVSCKNDKKNETEAKEPEKVAEASEMAATYKVDTEQSVINWKGAKLTGGGHEGVISFKGGELSMNDNMLEHGELVIDMTSIQVEDLEGEKKQNLEAHLKGTVEGKEGDFFNVKKYNTATFEITGINKKDGMYMLNGNLTLKEKTNNISIPVQVEKNNEALRLSSEAFMIDRTKWDVNYGSKSVFDDLVGNNVINDEIELQVKVYASKV